MRRYSSGQRGQTVNLLALAYEGSNPSRRTNENRSNCFNWADFYFAHGIRKGCRQFRPEEEIVIQPELKS